ncbi:hypothetical protein OAH33_00380 [bacterium]|nr:hypothetical protein [bacterium]
MHKITDLYWELARILIEKLNDNSVDYCHWKSNLNVGKAMAGFDDLDLLINRNDFNRCQIILSELGFKEASNRIQHIHSIRHYYGLDLATGEILHVHLYVSLITGPSWTKGYSFPIEKEYLGSACLDNELKIRLPQKEFELALFLIRVCLKYSCAVEFPFVIVARKKINEEIEFLLKDSSITTAGKIFNRLTCESSDDLFLSIIDTKVSLPRLVITAIKVRLKLGHWRTLSLAEQLRKSFWQLCYRVINKLFLKRKKNFSNGGILISFVGLDASGKSSMLHESDKWLSERFNVRKLHFGRPMCCVITFLPNLLIKLNKKIKGKKRISNSYDDNGKKSLIYVVRNLILAYDRYRVILKGRKWSRKGYVVLVDRYKSENIGVMDSPKLDPKKLKSFKRYLAKVENNLYHRMSLVDLMLHLRVPLDVAIKRNNERLKSDKETRSELTLRYQVNKDLVYRAKRYHVIDTSENYNHVLSRIKALIWECL